MEEKIITIVTQAFYGNRMRTEIKVKNIDRFILGYTGEDLPVTEKIDRTIIKEPNSNIVFMYNKYEEEINVKYGIMKTAVFPEENLELHSRVIACRVNENGEYESLMPEDFEIVCKYFLA